jgi:hypothetical protein
MGNVDKSKKKENCPKNISSMQPQVLTYKENPELKRTYDFEISGKTK